MPEPEHENFPAEQVGYTPCAGLVPGLAERTLATDPDGGLASRMLRFELGTDTTPNGVQVTRLLERALHPRRRHHRPAPGQDLHRRHVRLPATRHSARPLA